MKLSKVLLFVLMIASLPVMVNAQKDFTQEAEDAFENEAYFSAIDKFKKAYSKEKSKAKKAEIIFKIAECYRLIEQPAQAETWYLKAIEIDYPALESYLYLADVLKIQGRYDKAIVQYQNFLEKSPGDSRGLNGVKACELAQEWNDNPSRYEIQNEVLLNSKEGDFSPTFAHKKLNELIFTSTREGATGSDLDSRSGANFSDLYYSKRDRKGKWSQPELLNPEVNTESNEGSACLDGRYNTMYFTRCEFERNSVNGCRIYKAGKQGIKWSEPEIVPVKADTFDVGHPSLSNDDKLLFFASNIPGGQGGKDIWYVKWNEESNEWGGPVNAGSEVNTEHDELFPYIHEDGSLFFASNGHIGMGGLDIFKAEKTGDESWGNVENLKSPVNSSSNDFGIIFEGTNKRGYFTSDRRGGKGSDDIYSFYEPMLVFALQGKISDVDTKSPIPGAVVKLIGTDGTSVEVETDELGQYDFAEMDGGDRYIQASTSYNILVSHDTYLNAKGQETTVGVDESTTFIHDFSLQSIEKEEIKFPEVLYDLAKADLRPESEDSLNFLYQTLVDNPTIVIELSAHTDSRGSDKLNEDLSQRRAQACVDYLIGRGIPQERMEPKGYGKRKLLITDAQIKKLSTEEEREAAHQKNRRTVFSVIRTDYVPKEPENSDMGNDSPENEETIEEGTN